MMKGLLLMLVVVTSSLTCTYAMALPSAQASKVRHYTGRCLDAAHHTGTDTNCEISAVVRAGNQLVFANDKSILGNGTSAVFSITVQDSGQQAALPLGFSHLDYQQTAAIHSTAKLEGLTKIDVADNNLIIATSAFNKVDNAAFQRILYWPQGRPQEAKLLGDPSLIRKQILASLGEPFFQVEAIAALPDDSLLLGVRKQGKSSKQAHSTFTLLKAPFNLKDGELKLAGPFEVFYQFKPLIPGDDRPLGLSGLEYDRFNDRLLATTSYEEGEEIGGYLWVWPMPSDSTEDQGPPQLVRNAQGAPLRFDNKPEGVEALSKTQILVVHDDDRVQVDDSETGKAKGPNEFAYSVIEFRDEAPGKNASFHPQSISLP
ncbi:hypothetical protein [Pseudomonas putida]